MTTMTKWLYAFIEFVLQIFVVLKRMGVPFADQVISMWWGQSYPISKDHAVYAKPCPRAEMAACLFQFAY